MNALDQADAAPPARRRRCLHRHRRAYRRHRRDPQHQGVRGGEGPGVLLRDHGGQPRRAGARPGPRRAGEGGAADAVLVSQVVTQKDAHIHNTTADVGRVPRGVPGRAGADPRRRRSAVRGGLGTARSGSTGSSGAGPRPARSRRYLVHEIVREMPTRKAAAMSEPQTITTGRGRQAGHPPALRALQPRPLRRQPRRRRLLARGLRRRRHRDVHHDRRGRGALRLVQ